MNEDCEILQAFDNVLWTYIFLAQTPEIGGFLMNSTQPQKLLTAIQSGPVSWVIR
jgi:hypothetical protein